MGTILLADMHKKGKIEFLGEIMLNGDSVLPYSMEVRGLLGSCPEQLVLVISLTLSIQWTLEQIAYKLHDMMNINDVPLSLSKARMHNAFPYCYRLA